MAPFLSIHWRPRAEPLSPGAVVALGDAADALARRLLTREDAEIARLQGVTADGMIAVIGATEDLPWVDGALYLGHDAAAPVLLLPTTLEPDLPADLLQHALAHRFPAAASPLALLPSDRLVIPLGGAGQISRRMLRRWLDTAGIAERRRNR